MAHFRDNYLIVLVLLNSWFTDASIVPVNSLQTATRVHKFCLIAHFRNYSIVAVIARVLKAA